MKARNKLIFIICAVCICLTAIGLMIVVNINKVGADEATDRTEIKNIMDNGEQVVMNNSVYMAYSVCYDQNYLYCSLTSSRPGNLVFYVDADNSCTNNESNVRFYVYSNLTWEVQYGNGDGYVTDATKNGITYFYEETETGVYKSYFRIELSKINLSSANDTIRVFNVVTTGWKNERNSEFYDVLKANKGKYIEDSGYFDALVDEILSDMYYITSPYLKQKPNYDKYTDSVSQYLGFGIYVGEEYVMTAIKRESPKFEQTILSFSNGGYFWNYCVGSNGNENQAFVRSANWRYAFYNAELAAYGRKTVDNTSVYYLLFEKSKLAEIDDGQYAMSTEYGSKILVNYGRNFYIEYYNNYYYESYDAYIKSVFDNTDLVSYSVDKPTYDDHEDSVEKYVGYGYATDSECLYFYIEREGFKVQRTVIRFSIKEVSYELVITNSFAGLRSPDGETEYDNAIVVTGYFVDDSGNAVFAGIALNVVEMQEADLSQLVVE